MTSLRQETLELISLQIYLFTYLFIYLQIYITLAKEYADEVYKACY